MKDHVSRLPYVEASRECNHNNYYLFISKRPNRFAMYHVSLPEVGAEGEVISRKSVIFLELPKIGAQSNHAESSNSCWNRWSLEFGELETYYLLGR